MYTATSGWMTQLYASISHLTLKDLFLPGAHDCGAFSGRQFSMINGFPIPEFVLKAIGCTQDLDTVDQFFAGVRYFDCRILCQAKPLFVHGPIKIDSSVFDFFRRLESAICSPSFSQEIVILKFSHMQFGNSRNKEQLYLKFQDEILRIFGKKLISKLSVPDLLTTTIGDLLTHGNIICILPQYDEIKLHPPFYDFSNIDTGYYTYNDDCTLLYRPCRHDSSKRCTVGGSAFEAAEVMQYLDCREKDQRTVPLKITQAHLQYDTANLLRMLWCFMFTLKEHAQFHNINKRVCARLVDNPKEASVVQFNFVTSDMAQIAFHINASKVGVTTDMSPVQAFLGDCCRHSIFPYFLRSCVCCFILLFVIMTALLPLQCVCLLIYMIWH